MDCRRFAETLTQAAIEPGRPRDAALDAHLAACAACRQEFHARQRLAQAMDAGLLASVSETPSPGFAAKVRARLAEQSSPRASWFSGWVPVAAGALAVVVLMVSWLALREAPAPPAASDPVVISRPAPRHPGHAAPGQLASAAPSKPHRARQARTVSARSLRRREPEVIVPPGQREAVLRFYAAVLRRRTDASWALEEMKPLVVAELTIPPLEPVAGDAGSPQSGNASGTQF